MTAAKRFHFQTRRFPKSEEGKQMLTLGIRIGYWPCLKAPFIQVAVWAWRIEFWYGLPSKEMQP